MAISNARDGSLPDDYSSAITVDSVEAAKLDARIFSADDFDGQTEGAASSGNFNYAMLQGNILGDAPPEQITDFQEQSGGQAQDAPIEETARQPFITQVNFSEAAGPPPPPSEEFDVSEQSTLSGDGPTYNSTTVYHAGDTSTGIGTNTHTSESSHTSQQEFITEIIREGGGDGGGDITIMMSEVNNTTNISYNTINIDNSVVGDTITNNGGTTLIDLGGTGGSVTNIVETVVNVTNNIVGDTIDGVGDTVTTILDLGDLGGTIGGVGDTITNILDLGDLGGTIGGVGNTITNILDLGDLGGTIGGVGDTVTNILDLGDLGGTIGGVGDTITNILDLGDLGDTVGGVGDTVTNILDLGDLGDTVGGVTETVTTLLDLGDLGGTIGGVGDTVTNILDLGDLGDTVGGVTETVTNLLDLGDVGGTIGGVGDTVTNILDLGDLGGTVGGVTETVTNLLDLGDLGDIGGVGDTVTNILELGDLGDLGGVTETVTNLLDLGGGGGGGGDGGGLTDIIGDLLGGGDGGGGSGDTDLVLDGAVGDGIVLPTTEVGLDPVEALLGDIDLHIDAQSDPSTTAELVTDLVGSAGEGDALGGVVQTVSTLLDGAGGGEQDGGDVIVGIGNGSEATSPLEVALNPLEGVLGDFSLNANGTTEVVGVDGGTLPVGGDDILGGLTETVTDLLGGESGGGDTDLVVDGSLGLGGETLVVPTTEVLLDPVEALIGDIDVNLDVPADLGAVDGDLVADLAGAAGDGEIGDGIVEAVTDFLDGGDLGDGLGGGLVETVADAIGGGSVGGGGGGGSDGDIDLTADGLAGIGGENLALPTLEANLDPLESLLGTDIDLEVGAAADLLDMAGSTNDGPLSSDLGLTVNDSEISLLDPDQSLGSLSDLFSEELGVGGIGGGGDLVEALGSTLDDIPQPGGDLSDGLQLVLDQVPLQLPSGFGFF